MSHRSAGSRLDGQQQALVALLAELRGCGYAFTTVSPSTHARVNARAGHDGATDLAGVFGWSRPFRPDVLPSALLGLLEAGDALARDGELCRSRVRVSSLGGALYLHSAFPTRDANSVFFGPDTYRFARACTAWLTPERAGRIRRAVDIGTGAGPGALTVAAAAPRARVDMVDVNEGALRLAEINAAAAGLRNAHAGLSDILASLDGEFDLVVSNPPYLNDPLGRAYRHGGGPFGAELSLRILAGSIGRLAPGGTLLLYTGVAIVNGVDPFRQAAEDHLCVPGLGWSYEEVDPDVFGDELDTEAYSTADRIAAVVLTATRKDERDG